MTPNLPAPLVFPAVLCTLATHVPATLAQETTESPRATGGPATTTFVTNVTRVESWSYFEPRPEGGDPRYTFVGNRLQFGVRHVAPRYELLGAGQYVQLGGLPVNATGPGPYGTGALYFSHSGSTGANRVYLRYLTVRLKELLPGLRVDVGRMGYSGGMESPSGNDAIEALKNLRVSARLLGEFEWSMFQRGYDGVRLDYSRPR